MHVWKVNMDYELQDESDKETFQHNSWTLQKLMQCFLMLSRLSSSISPLWYPTKKNQQDRAD